MLRYAFCFSCRGDLESCQRDILTTQIISHLPDMVLRQTSIRSSTRWEWSVNR